jgi:Protein of unknown function (DUF4087)
MTRQAWRRCLLALAVSVCLGAAAQASGPPAQSGVTRCGWFDNPSPGNASLIDAQGEWIIGMQGGHQAKGAWPVFARAQWVRTGTGSHGYGCACLRVQADADSNEVSQIISARARPLSACRADKSLAGGEPVNPLK